GDAQTFVGGPDGRTTMVGARVRADDGDHHETTGGNHDPACSPHRHPPYPPRDPVRAHARAAGTRGRDRLARAAPRGRRGRATHRSIGMTVEIIGVALVAIVPALLFIGWLAMMVTVVAALGASSDRDIDEITLLRSSSSAAAPRPRRAGTAPAGGGG